MLTFLFVVPLATCGYENKVALNACHLGSHIHRLADSAEVELDVEQQDPGLCCVHERPAAPSLNSPGLRS